MTDRSVVVRLRAVTTEYNAAMARAGQSTKALTKDLAAGVKKSSKELDALGSEATIAGASLIGLGVAAVATTVRFDKQMSAVRAASRATGTEIERLRAQALRLGADTVFSATEAAQGQEELAKAGLSTAAILGGALDGALSLAAAGGIEVKDAAETAATALKIFGLQGRDTTHVADLLAAGAGNAQGGVDDLGMALKQSGLVAAQTGLTIEETTAGLSAFASAGLLGSDAGTSFKTMLQRLTPQSAEAAAKMDELGINAYDARGNFIGLEAFAGKLRTGLSKLTPEARSSALSIIFGSDAVRAAAVLYNEGADGIREWTAKVDDSGYAAEQAALRLDNLAGDVEQLSGSIESTFIKSGSGANSLLREMTQAATGAVNVVGSLPTPVLATGAAAAVAGGAFLIAAPKIVAFNAAMAESPALARAARLAIKGLGPAIAVAGIASLALDMQAADQANEDLRRSIRGLITDLEKGRDAGTAYDDLQQKITDLQNQISDPGPVKKAESFLRGLWTDFRTDGVDAVDAYNAELNQLQPELDAATNAVAQLNYAVSDAAQMTGMTFDEALKIATESGIDLTGSTEDITRRLVDYITTQKSSTSASQRAADAMNALADNTLSAEDRAKAFTDTWNATIGALTDSGNAEIAAERALDDLTDALKKNGSSFDINTEKGRENKAAFLDLVDTAGRVAQDKLAETGSVDQANEAYRKYLERLLKAPGLTDKQRTALKKLIGEGFDKLPKDPVVVTVDANTEPARTALRTLADYYASLFSSYRVGGSTYNSQVPKAASSTNTNTSGGDPRKGTAGGGFVRGPGPSNVDSFLQPMANGEFATRASIAQAHAPLMVAVNDGRLGDAFAYLGSVLGRGAGSGASISIGQITAVSAPGERAAESVPRALRAKAFELGMG